MNKMIIAVFLCCFCTLAFAEIRLDEKAAEPGEWGYRPENGSVSPVTPPAFSWRPTSRIVRWQIDVAENSSNKSVYMNDQISFTAFTPPLVFPQGEYQWKYRGFDAKNEPTNWSETRFFSINKNSKKLPMAADADILSKIPKSHPRIFVRPEWIKDFRDLSTGTLKNEFDYLVRQCNRLLENPPDTTEPALYSEGKNHKDEPDVWWGNRTKTIAVLENAALLAFVWSINNDNRFADLSKKLLMEAAKWDPKGATGYRYNDEAGMPYNYNFARTYSFLNAYLSEEEKQKCREIMAIRGKEMYDHLYPRQFWTPYGSHQNRAWHKLCEIGIAFYGEIPDSPKWIIAGMNIFYGVYPVWSDSDGGWHEGVSYWQSYQIRFCWMADVLKAAFDINAFDKPYYSQIGYYAMYLMPPGRIGGGFGDLCNTTSSTANLPLMSILALQSGNPYWNWYVQEQNFKEPSNYYTFIRKASNTKKPMPPMPPTDLPTSRLFSGTGQAYLNTNLLDAKENVQIVFKSSPMGTQSHGYEANNSYFLSAWNENLLINTGRRDLYGSAHHVNWMWSTRSVNNILVDGIGQHKRNAKALGKITHFETNAQYDIVVGETPKSYEKDILDRYTRSIVFLKPDCIIVYDQLSAKQPATFEYWLHAQKPFQSVERYFPNGKSKENDGVFASLLKEIVLEDPNAVSKFEPITDQNNIAIRVDKVACQLNILLPKKLSFEQTNQYDPNPKPKIKVREWHLKATTLEKQKDIEFLLVARPWRVADEENAPQADVSVKQQENGLILTAKYANGKSADVRFYSAPGKNPVVIKGS